MDGERRNLLQEVDVISSVSGGSFTAAHYGLNEDAIFEKDGRFQKNFLYKDVEATLTAKLFNPYNWIHLLSPTFGRIELANEVYQDLLFDQNTFLELQTHKNRPFVLINATDMYQVELYRMYVGFDQIEDEKERENFFSIKTTFSRPTEQVDALRKMGGVLLEKLSCFQKLTGPPNNDSSNSCIYWHWAKKFHPHKLNV